MWFEMRIEQTWRGFFLPKQTLFLFRFMGIIFLGIMVGSWMGGVTDVEVWQAQ